MLCHALRGGDPVSADTERPNTELADELARAAGAVNLCFHDWPDVSGAFEDAERQHALNWLAEALRDYRRAVPR